MPTLAPRLARTVATLLGAAQVDTALLCLGSLLRYSADPLALRLHDDGTLRAEDRARLEAGLGPVTFVPRPEADAQLEARLASYPACRAYRREHPLALKLLDAALLAEGGELAFCDTDILFLRPFQGLFDRPEGVRAVLMQDRQSAYSVRSWHLALHRRVTLPQRANSGLLSFDLSAFDLDWLEWFLRQQAFRFAPMWTEQTAWAALAQRAGCALLDGRQVRIPGLGEVLEVGGETVALHFVSPVRAGLVPTAAGAPDRRGEGAVRVGHGRAVACRAWTLALEEGGRWWGRVLARKSR